MRKQLFTILGILFLITSTSVFAKTTLRVGYLPILDHITLVVSYEKDNKTFKEVDVELKIFKRWDELAGALDAGAIDAAFILSPLAMDMFNSGMDIRTVLLAHRNGSAITVGKDSEITSARMLKGKIVAVPNKKATHVALLDTYLRSDGLSLKDVETTVIAPPNMEEALKSNKIDAFIVAEPFGAKAKVHGYGRVLVLTKDIINNHVECIVVVKNKFLKENKPAMQEWVDSLIRAGKFIEKDRHENNSGKVIAITNKYMGHDDETTREALQNPHDRITFNDLNPKLSDYKKIMDIAVQAGIIGKVELESFVDGRFFKNSKEK